MANLALPDFVPYPLLRNGWVQTVIGNFNRGIETPPRSSSLVVRVDSDGDSIACDIDHRRPPATVKTCLVLLHGMGGSAESSYMLRISGKILAAGDSAAVVRFNHRNAAQASQTLARAAYHAGRDGDILCTLAAVHEYFPNADIFLVGFSLSGCALLKMLGTRAGLQKIFPRLQRALAVCPAIDLEATSLELDRWHNKPIDIYFTHKLVRFVEERRAFAHWQGLTLPHTPRMSVRKFDELFTAPLGGYLSRSHYFASASAKPYLKHIDVPTLVLADRHDPVVPFASFSDAELSPSIRIHVTRHGGHMGYLSIRETPWHDRRWLDWAVIHWLNTGRLV